MALPCTDEEAFGFKTISQVLALWIDANQARIRTLARHHTCPNNSFLLLYSYCRANEYFISQILTTDFMATAIIVLVVFNSVVS